jgi:hypothetical protein
MMVTSISKSFEVETPVVCSKCGIELKAEFSEKDKKLYVDPHICVQD